MTALQQGGHEAEAIRIPFAVAEPERLVEEMLVARSIRVRNVDRAIALRFPAYLVPHPNKVIWLVDPFRHAYDAGSTSRSRNDDRSRRIGRAVRGADLVAFAEAKRLFATTPVAAQRLQRVSGAEAAVLPAPEENSENWTATVEQLLA